MLKLRKWLPPRRERLSIGGRLLGITAITVLLLLPLLGVYISAAFRVSAEEAFDARLEAYGYSLVGLLRIGPDGAIGFSSVPGELRFDQVFSGWYWQVDRNGTVLGSSRSLWDQTLPVAGAAPAERNTRHGTLMGPRGQLLHAWRLYAQLDGARDSVWLTVAGPVDEIEEAVGSFNTVLFASLTPLGLVLIGALVAQIRWGLAPLRDMRRGLRDVYAGRSRRLDVRLPSDLKTVADAMNEVLSHQDELLVRGRSVAGNLAHALKTPLSSLRLHLVRDDIDREALRNDLDRLQQIVDHHLTRASAAGLAGGGFQRTRLLASLLPVFEALRAMHGERMPALSVEIADTLEVRVDAQDLQELAGNLLDNAAKWARSRIVIQAQTVDGAIELAVDDDGPGIAEQDFALAAGRGMRLDEQRPGSGLGLAIVGDIARLYHAELRLERSRLGGLRACLRFERPGETAR